MYTYKNYFPVSRSVSISGESERKMVKEIVRRARDPVKSRVIPTDIVEKYRKKLATIEEDVKKVIEEETAEREIAKVENKANRLQNKINDKVEDPDRVWFQSKQERLDEKNKLKEENRKITKKMKKKKEAATPVDPAEAKEQKALEMEANFVARQAKRSRKPKKMSVFKEDSIREKKPKKGGKKSKSSFDDDVRKGGGGISRGGGGGGMKRGGGGAKRVGGSMNRGGGFGGVKKGGKIGGIKKSLKPKKNK